MQIIEKDISWLYDRVFDFEPFYKKYKPLFKNGYIAGGFLRKVILRGSVQAVISDLLIDRRGDIDFFFETPPDVHMAVGELASIIEQPRPKEPNSYTKYAFELLEFNKDYRFIKFQLIYKNTGAPQTVLHRFDLSNCKIATNGEKVWMVEDWEELEGNKIIRIDNFAGDYLLKRLFKYLTSGYSLYKGNKEEFLAYLLDKRQDATGIRTVLKRILGYFSKETITIFYGLLGFIDEGEKDGSYDFGSMGQPEDFALHMVKRLAELEEGDASGSKFSV